MEKDSVENRKIQQKKGRQIDSEAASGAYPPKKAPTPAIRWEKFFPFPTLSPGKTLFPGRNPLPAR